MAFIDPGSLLQDLQFGARMLRRHLLFTVTTVLSVGIGIGVDTSVFSVANAVLFRQPTGVVAPERLVDISQSGQGNAIVGFFPYAAYRSVAERVTTFDGLYGHDLVPKPMSVSTDGVAERVSGNVVTASYFDVLGVHAAAGRLFHASDGDQTGTSPYVVLSERYWSRRFGRNPNIVGQQVTINQKPVSVLGVAQAGFHGTTLLSPDVWVPLSVASSGGMAAAPELLLGGRLKPGLSASQAQADLQSAFNAFQRERGSLESAAMRVTPLAAIPGNALPVGPFFALLLAGVSVVLVIACANLTATLLARAISRRQERAVRVALGAARRRVVRQMLVETTLLFCIAGAVGLAIARGLTVLMLPVVAALPLPIELSLPLDWRVFAFAFTLALIAGLLSGLLPALHASGLDLRIQMHEETAAGVDRRRLRHTLLVAQIALAIVLVVSAGLLGRALRNAASVDVGYDATGVQLMSFNLSLAGYAPERIAAFARELRARAERLSSAPRAAIAATVPMGDPLMTAGFVTRPGESLPSRNRSAMALGNVVEPGYFATMHIPLVAGRDFTFADRADGEAVAIIGEATAKRLWPGQPAVGRQIVVHQPLVEQQSDGSTNAPMRTMTRTIVGVARDVKYASLADAPAPLFVYVPLEQQPASTLTLIARSRDPRIASELRAVLASMDSSVPVVTQRAMNDNIALALMPQRIAAAIAGSLGVIGLLLAGLGIYGVIAFSFSRRTRELAIRMALGAERHQVRGMVLGQGLRLTAVGAATGVVLAAAGSQLLRRLLFGVPSLDPPTFVGTILLVAVVALVACYVPARRATSIQPADVLRNL
jgi:predicted permease